MNKLVLCAIGSLAALTSAGIARGQGCAGHCSQCQMNGGRMHSEPFKAAYYENHIWPQQYVQPSRRAICQSYELMIANGWRRSNLLGKYDFAPDGSGLSEAGRLRLQWILTQAPPNRRTIFVQRAADAQQTAQRIEAVQALASNFDPSLGPADVQETYMYDEGRPAAAVDAVFTGFGANQPLPILPSSGGSSSSDSGE